jgi:hypothetical protein
MKIILWWLTVSMADILGFHLFLGKDRVWTQAAPTFFFSFQKEHYLFRMKVEYEISKFLNYSQFNVLELLFVSEM